MGKTCNGCKEDEKTPVGIPFAAHESVVAKLENIIKRQWIALIVAISIIFGCNAMWLYAWMQYDYTSTTEKVAVETVINDNEDTVQEKWQQ